MSPMVRPKASPRKCCSVPSCDLLASVGAHGGQEYVLIWKRAGKQKNTVKVHDMVPGHSWAALVRHVQAADLGPEERHVPSLHVVDHRHSHTGALDLFAHCGGKSRSTRVCLEEILGSSGSGESSHLLT